MFPSCHDVNHSGVEPSWLQISSWAAIAVGCASALAILVDELLLGNRRHMAVMNLVHPITALYLGPLWLWVYVRQRRTDSQPPRAWQVAGAVSHCGAGCTLGDLGGEWILYAVFASPALGVAGTYSWEVIADFVLAWTLGIAFQYFTIVPMRLEVGPLRGIAQAMKADTLSILAFQLGLFGWMALAHFVLLRPPPTVDTSGHWFMMQVGMIAGFATAWPINSRLIRTGVKEKMGSRHSTSSA